MAFTDINLADRQSGLVESHKGYDPRIIFFYFVIAAMLVVLVCGLAYQQLRRVGKHADRERQQTQRLVLTPGPRGNIYDRNGTALVTNRPRWTVVLHLDELKPELDREFYRIKKNYKDADEKDIPGSGDIRKIARVSVAQRYLDQVNHILKQSLTVDTKRLRNHFDRELLLPFTLLDDLEDSDYAKLIERLPISSPLKVYATSERHYPFESAAAHTLGYVRPDAEVEAEGYAGQDLQPFKMMNTSGRDGLEKWFDADLQGKAGARIYLVDPSGFRVTKSLTDLPAPRLPKQGKDLVTSLDIDLQRIAEQELGDQRGAVVAIDVATGEVLVMASRPDYDLNAFSPRATQAIVDKIEAAKAWNNLALNGLYAPGSTFKILTTIAALRRGVITPDDAIVNCTGSIMVGNRRFQCDVGQGHHGNVLLRDAITYSCDVYYYVAGERTTPKGIADEARRFHFDQRTGIELPGETGRMIVPDPDWKRIQHDKHPLSVDARWYPGDTANMSIGQGDVLVTPLEMACFTASVARGEVVTKPTLLHDPTRARQRTEPIGLTSEQRRALIEGMEGTIIRGSARNLNTPAYRIPGITLVGKTGTAQVTTGKKNVAWFIGFAPAENPEIAIAVTVEGDVGEEFYGGMNAAPAAGAVLKKYFEKKANPSQAIVPPVKGRKS